MGQLVTALNSRPQGTLRSDTDVNLKRDSKEKCEDVTHRSGRTINENGGEISTMQEEVAEKEPNVESMSDKSGGEESA